MKLILKNANLHLRTYETRSTRENPLFHAIMSEKQKAVHLILMCGIDKKKTNFKQQTPEDFLRSLGLNLDLNKKDIQAMIPIQNTLGASDKKSITIDDFEIKQKLGQGAFGEVYLAVDKSSGKEVALKQMVKAVIKEKGKKEHVDCEKKILQYS